MKKGSKNREKWLKMLGKNISLLIAKKGYKSPYEFWIERLGDDISRASLNYILNGEVEMRIGTLKAIADALEVDPSEILKIDSN